MSWKQDLNLYVFWWFMISRSTILLFHAAAASAALPGRLQDGSWDHGQGQGKGSRPLAPNPVFDCVFFHSFRCNQFNKTLSWWWNALLNFQNLSCVFLMIWRFSANFSPLKNAGRMRIRAFWMLSRIWFAEHFGLWPACGYLEIAPSSRCQGNCTAHWLCLFLQVWRGLDRLPLSLWLQGRSKTWWRSWPLQCSTESQERLCKKYGSVPSTKEEQYIKICGRFPQEMRKKAMKTLVSVANYIAEMDQRNIEKGIPN